MKAYDPNVKADIFDFGKLVPMPETLDIVSSADIDKAVTLYKGCNLSALPPREVQKFQRDKSFVNHLEELAHRTLGNDCGNIYMLLQDYSMDELFQKIKQTKEGAKLYGYGEAAYKNIVFYDAPTWYEWRIKNWGTKWNSYDVSFCLKDKMIAFNTAWSCPVPVIRKLVDIFPEIPFVLDYADEDFGSNAGRIEYDRKEFRHIEYEDGSPEACNTYVNIWGESPCLYQDESGLWRHYNCDDCPNPC